MKRLITILTLFFIFINLSVFAESNIIKKDLKVITDDGFRIQAVLEYSKSLKKEKNVSTVVLVHSLGYSSGWWENLPDELLAKGYAVLLIDLRGHGGSIYNSKLARVSWKNLTNHAFSKYPSDVLKVFDFVASENPKKEFFNNWAIVGADIGANTAVVAASKYKNKPKTVVMLSPSVSARGIYIPVKLAELGNVDILSISSSSDNNAIKTNEYLKKFAQAEYVQFSSESRSNGMLMLKNDKNLVGFITSWIDQYLR